MGLIILTTLLCLAHLSAAMCPQYRPLTASKSCKNDTDCPSRKSCCTYSGYQICVPNDPNTCFSDGKIVKKGDSILLKDNCTTCDCYGYDSIICTNDGCIWPKVAPKMEADLSAAMCPQYRPLTVSQSCKNDTDCPSQKSCCTYSGYQICVYNDPNTCVSSGKIVKKGDSILLKDNCTTCDCYGYDSIICTDDGCIWPKVAPKMEAAQECPMMRPASANKRCIRSNSCSSGFTCCKYQDGNFCTFADPNTCIHNGTSVSRGTIVILEDGCSECECQGHDGMMCINDACFWPKPTPKPGCHYNGVFRPEGSGFLSIDGCNRCFCSDGEVLCTLKACI